MRARCQPDSPGLHLSRTLADAPRQAPAFRVGRCSP
jgi:hypothetical protein